MTWVVWFTFSNSFCINPCSAAFPLVTAVATGIPGGSIEKRSKALRIQSTTTRSGTSENTV